MQNEVIAFTLDLIGKTLIGIAVIMVHSKIVSEKRIDKKVLREIQHEKILSLMGIFLMAIAYLFHIIG